MVRGGLAWKTCLVYLDDIMVIGQAFKQHLTNLEKMFSRMKETNLKLNPKKYLLFQKEVAFLGHGVSASGIKTSEIKINGIRDWARRRDIAAPLHSLTDLKSQFNWTAECEAPLK